MCNFPNWDDKMATQGGVIASKEEWRQHKYILGNWSNGKTRNNYNKPGKSMVMQGQASSWALFPCFEPCLSSWNCILYLWIFPFLGGEPPYFSMMFFTLHSFFDPASLCKTFWGLPVDITFDTQAQGCNDQFTLKHWNEVDKHVSQTSFISIKISAFQSSQTFNQIQPQW
jgi:hypothetical protein